MYAMMIGKLPFQGKDANETMALVCNGYTDSHIMTLKMAGISVFGRRMIARCLEVSSKLRMNIQQIIENPWFFDVAAGDQNVGLTCSKAQVLQKMHEEYFPRQSTRVIESAIQSRPYGRVAGLYRLLNIQMEQGKKVDDQDQSKTFAKPAKPHQQTKRKIVRFNIKL